MLSARPGERLASVRAGGHREQERKARVGHSPSCQATLAHRTRTTASLSVPRLCCAAFDFAAACSVPELPFCHRSSYLGAVLHGLAPAPRALELGAQIEGGAVEAGEVEEGEARDLEEAQLEPEQRARAEDATQVTHQPQHCQGRQGCVVRCGVSECGDEAEQERRRGYEENGGVCSSTAWWWITQSVRVGGTV
eukprot:1436968-Rhodomonas_salina.1